MDWTWVLTGLAGAIGCFIRAWSERRQATKSWLTVAQAGIGGAVFGIAYPAIALTPVIGTMIPLPHGNLAQNVAIILGLGYFGNQIVTTLLGRFGFGPAAPPSGGTP